MTEKNENESTITVPMDTRTQRFYQGVAVGSQVLKAHADTDFPDEQARLALFYFYAGALAVADHKCSTGEDFEGFLLGLATRAPQPNVEDQRILDEVREWTDEEFALALGFSRGYSDEED